MTEVTIEAIKNILRERPCMLRCTIYGAYRGLNGGRGCAPVYNAMKFTLKAKAIGNLNGGREGTHHNGGGDYDRHMEVMVSTYSF